MMPLLLAIALGVLALAYVLYPLVRRTPNALPIDSVTGGGQENERAARSALQEVELDFQLGNIAEEEYRSLRERYMRRALASMKARYEREEEIDNEIEEQLRRMKEQENNEAS